LTTVEPHPDSLANEEYLGTSGSIQPIEALNATFINNATVIYNQTDIVTSYFKNKWDDLCPITSCSIKQVGCTKTINQYANGTAYKKWLHNVTLDTSIDNQWNIKALVNDSAGFEERYCVFCSNKDT